MFQQSEQTRIAPILAEPEEQPLLAPVTRELSWSWLHGLTQRPLRPNLVSPDAEPVAILRRSAVIRRGTRMIKLLTARQLGSILQGRLPSGFCYRAYDLATLATSAALSMLTGAATTVDESSVLFGLRWRAMDPSDYHIPFGLTVGDLPDYPGLTDIAPHDRQGPPVLGNGFAPSEYHLVPEFVTADLADLPLTANAQLVAFPADGPEVTLYTYLPEQRAWTKMFGPQWRYLLQGVSEVPADQEYLPVNPGPQASSLVGQFRGESYEAIADPPHEYRVNARARAARYPIETLACRTWHATWRGVAVTVVRSDGDWLRVRFCRPDRDSAPVLGAQCLERGSYEAWANAADVASLRPVDREYQLDA